MARQNWAVAVFLIQRFVDFRTPIVVHCVLLFSLLMICREGILSTALLVGDLVLGGDKLEGHDVLLVPSTSFNFKSKSET